MPLNYAVQYNALQRRYGALVSLLRRVLRILSNVAAVPASAGALRRAVALLATELGDDTSDDAEEPEKEAEDMVGVNVAAGAMSAARTDFVPPGFLAFSGRIYRLA